MLYTRLFRLVLLVVLTGFIAKSIPAQAPSSDSLKDVLRTIKDDRAKAEKLTELLKILVSTRQYDSALVYCDKTIRIAKKSGYLTELADALYFKSLAYKGKRELKSALDVADEFIDLYVELNDSLRLAKGYYNIGLMNKDAGNYDLASYYCEKSLSFCIPLNDSVLIAANYNSIGLIFSEGLAKPDSAVYYYLKSLEISEKFSNRNNLATLLNNLGDVFLTDKNYDEAYKYFNMSLDVNLQTDNRNLHALILTNMGRLTIESGNADTALQYYQRATEIYEELGNKMGVANNQINAGDAYFSKKMYPKALEYIDKALSYFESIQYQRGILTAMLNKSAVYSELGQVDLAVELQDSCLQLATLLDNDPLELLTLRNIADNFKKSGKYKEACSRLEDALLLNEKVFDIEKSKTTQYLLARYEKEKDQARILILERDNLKKTNQRNSYLFGGIAFVIVVFFLLIYIRQKAKHEKVMARQKIRQLEEEKKLLAARLLVEGQEEERKRIATELHDGLGVLLSATKMQFSTISDKSPENMKLIEKATKMLEQASGDVRKISHNMMPGLLTKFGFYEAVEDLFEQVGDAGEIHASCIILGNQVRLSENKEIMLYRIIQELVNNTLKHAQAKEMSISIKILPDKMDITYSDDGKGFDYPQKLESESLGLKSIQSRVNFLNGTLVVDSKPGSGVKFSMSIPA
jgi:two-component system, NarL family, sensor kinase